MRRRFLSFQRRHIDPGAIYSVELFLLDSVIERTRRNPQT
jgi:hypothetical protein